MKLLVSGVSGLIGRHVALAAAEAGLNVVGTSRARPSDLPQEVRFEPADLSDAGQAEELVRRTAPTHIVHAAWETRQPTYWNDVRNLDWVISTARMATAFAEVGGQRFIQVGSCAEYDWSHGICIEGETPDLPQMRYGKAKLAAFRAIEAAAHDAFQAVEARIFFVYGPGENADRFIPFVCRSHLAGKVPQLGSGRQLRDLLHARDAARAILSVANANEMVGIVNIGGGTPRPLSDVAEILARLAGARENGLGQRPDREGDPALLIANSDRLRSTGWTPTVSLEDGLSGTFGWWRAHESHASSACRTEA